MSVGGGGGQKNIGDFRPCPLDDLETRPFSTPVTALNFGMLGCWRHAPWDY